MYADVLSVRKDKKCSKKFVKEVGDEKMSRKQLWEKVSENFPGWSRLAITAALDTKRAKSATWEAHTIVKMTEVAQILKAMVESV